MSRKLLGSTLVTMMILLTAAAYAGPGEAGFSRNTTILEADGEFCPGTTLLQNDDGTVENGYLWSFMGVQEPDYGSWAECYNSDFVCGVQFLFTQTGYYTGQTFDVYVWDYDADGNPPPGPDPGNILCVLRDLSPGPIAFWPDVSTHNVQVCCETGGDHFVGFWGNWPLNGDVWFIASDEDGPGGGCPRTKIAPGIGYPTGWQEVTIVSVFDDCNALFIRELAGPCEPTPARETTWGQIKALY